MIEKIILNYLSKKLEVPVYMEEQKEKVGSYVVIEKLGSARVDRINRASFAVQSYAKSMEEAAILNEKVVDAMLKIIETEDIGSVKLDSDYNFTDTQTKRYRYQAVFDLYY